MSSKAFDAFTPAHAALAEHLAVDFAGEQFAPEQVGPPAIAIHTLQGHSQLVAIARIDPILALKLKWLLDSIQEADFDSALDALDHVAFSIRSLRLDTRADEAGVIHQ
jgi:hypothetical protein